jgi:pimeloyl-ACP methyl ester carboxylesterase
MHGTNGSPAGNIAKLGGLLRMAGATVIEPRMAWSQTRIMDASWEQEIVEIDQAIAQVRAMGARKVVLAGHSRGGTAVVAYAARRHGPDALVVLAPGPAGVKGQPEWAKVDLSDIVAEKNRAKQLLQTGHGDEWGTFLLSDVSRLRITTRFYIWTTARIYMSYGNESVFSAQAAAPRLPRVPTLWINTALDIAIESQRIAAYMMPKNPRSVVLELPDTFHEDVPDHSRFYVLQWLQSLRW